jgi:ribosomal silencing factor RsfS
LLIFIKNFQIVQFNLLKKESKLKYFVETSDNPFDQVKAIVGLDNKNRKKENKFEKLRKEIEKEKDKDIKQDLKKGNIVTIIE